MNARSQAIDETEVERGWRHFHFPPPPLPSVHLKFLIPTRMDEKRTSTPLILHVEIKWVSET